MRSQPGFAHSAPGYYRQQQGHAAILFALFIPILFGIFTLGTDGARAVQDKARLAEAVEVASLAVAGAGSDDKTLAKAYIQDYFPYAEVDDSDITIRKINCENNASCQDSEQRFFEYQVSAKIHQPTWFPGNETIVGFGENYDVASGAVSRKYHAETVDVVLVADFSSSMFEGWEGGDKKKFLDLKDIIIEVINEIENFNKYNISDKNNKIAIVGFDFYTSRRVNGDRLFYSHLICRNSKTNKDKTRCDARYPGNDHVVGYGADKKHIQINEGATIRDVFDLSSIANKSFKKNITNISVFEDVTLTDDMDEVKRKIRSTKFNVSQAVGSGTSSYAGIIRGAQIAKEGDNSRRLIILLSDGEDTFQQTTNKLINPSNPGSAPENSTSLGLCNKVINVLNSQQTPEGHNVTARMVAVGFGYDINKFPQMKNCVGQDNVFKAENREDIKNKILELITEEIGHLAP